MYVVLLAWQTMFHFHFEVRGKLKIFNLNHQNFIDNFVFEEPSNPNLIQDDQTWSYLKMVVFWVQVGKFLQSSSYLLPS